MLSPGAKKWGALVIWIGILEVLPGETLSTAHYRAVQGSLDKRARMRNRVPIVCAHGYIVAHLWGLVPQKYDPLSRLALLVVEK